MREYSKSEEEDVKMFQDLHGRYGTPMIIDFDDELGVMHILFETKTYTIKITEVQD